MTWAWRSAWRTTSGNRQGSPEATRKIPTAESLLWRDRPWDYVLTDLLQ